MTNFKYFELLYGVVCADIKADGELVYKINLENNGLILRNADNTILAEIDIIYFPFFRKNVIKAHFVKDNKTITVNKNLFGTEHYINLEGGEILTIKYKWANGYYTIPNQIIRFQRIGGNFSKFTQKLDFELEDTRESQMIFITFFFILRKMTDR